MASEEGGESQILCQINCEIKYLFVEQVLSCTAVHCVQGM